VAGDKRSTWFLGEGIRTDEKRSRGSLSQTQLGGGETVLSFLN